MHINTNMGAKMTNDVQFKGQVFTPPALVDAMLKLRENGGSVLEPSCGDGAFLGKLELGAVGIEFDQAVAHPRAIVTDFFNYALHDSQEFDTIIGNPPYVASGDIQPETKRLLMLSNLDLRSNLYMYFIERCLDKLAPSGEMIFVVPITLLTATSAAPLRERMFDRGTITHLLDLGGARGLFGANVDTIVFRYERGNYSRLTKHASVHIKASDHSALADIPWELSRLVYSGSGAPFLFLRESIGKAVLLSEIASVSVGAASGADDIFQNDDFANMDFVSSQTRTTGETKKMLWEDQEPAPNTYLDLRKDLLMQRKVRRFHEGNWWMWGRSHRITDAPRVYVNVKTRRENPFFTHECKNYDGSILAIFPKNPGINLDEFAADLNAVDWAARGMLVGGRYAFGKRSLEHVTLPESMRKYLP